MMSLKFYLNLKKKLSIELCQDIVGSDFLRYSVLALHGRGAGTLLNIHKAYKKFAFRSSTSLGILRLIHTSLSYGFSRIHMYISQFIANLRYDTQ